jgi:hypothetical protein
VGLQAGRNPSKACLAQHLRVFQQLGWEAGVVAQIIERSDRLRMVKNGPDKIAISASTIFVIQAIRAQRFPTFTSEIGSSRIYTNLKQLLPRNGFAEITTKTT